MTTTAGCPLALLAANRWATDARTDRHEVARAVEAARAGRTDEALARTAGQEPAIPDVVAHAAACAGHADLLERLVARGASRPGRAALSVLRADPCYPRAPEEHPGTSAEPLSPPSPPPPRSPSPARPPPRRPSPRPRRRATTPPRRTPPARRTTSRRPRRSRPRGSTRGRGARSSTSSAASPGWRSGTRRARSRTSTG